MPNDGANKAVGKDQTQPPYEQIVGEIVRSMIPETYPNRVEPLVAILLEYSQAARLDVPVTSTQRYHVGFLPNRPELLPARGRIYDHRASALSQE